MKLSIVVPMYNEEDLIEEYCKRTESSIKSLKEKFDISREEIEIIFVNDGSRDNTLKLLKEKCTQDTGYCLLNLSRNFGHQIAISTGMEFSSGDAVVVIDGDLQDPPEFIVDLYQKHLEGYDVVYAIRRTREGESWFKLITARIFYRFLKRMTNLDFPVDTGDFRLMSRRVVNALNRLKEQNRYIRGLVSWTGFKQTGIEYDRHVRHAGASKYPLSKMLKFAMDGITSFSTIPLKLSLNVGFITAFLGFIYALYAIYEKIFLGVPIRGWSSLIVAVLVVGGVQLFTIGIIGEYVGRIYDEVKNRPLYFIEGIYKSKS